MSCSYQDPKKFDAKCLYCGHNIVAEAVARNSYCYTQCSKCHKENRFEFRNGEMYRQYKP